MDNLKWLFTTDNGIRKRWLGKVKRWTSLEEKKIRLKKLINIEMNVCTQCRLLKYYLNSPPKERERGGRLPNLQSTTDKKVWWSENCEHCEIITHFNLVCLWLKKEREGEQTVTARNGTLLTHCWVNLMKKPSLNKKGSDQNENMFDSWP